MSKIKIQIVGQEDLLQRTLVNNVRDVLKEIQCECELAVVHDLQEIMEFEKRGILVPPALIVNGHILCEGNMWNEKHIKHILERIISGKFE